MGVSNKQFSQALEELFEQNQKLSLNEVARRASVDPAYIWRLRRGEKTHPSVKIIKEIAHAFGVEPHYFLEYRAHILAEVAQKWPELIERGLSPEKSLRLLQLEERRKTDNKVAELYDVLKWLIATEEQYPLVDETHELLLYGRHEIVKGVDRESTTTMRGVNKRENHQPSSGIQLVLTGGSYVAFDSLKLMVKDNKENRELSPILLSDEGTKKLVFVPFLESLGYEEEFDITISFTWKGTYNLATDWLSLNMTRFIKGVQKVEQILSFSECPSRLDVYTVKLEDLRVESANQTLTDVVWPGLESFKSLHWVQEPFDYKQIVVFLFSRDLLSSEKRPEKVV
jgi:transcriptional regulator with XRE-family HTH domain